MIMLKGQVVPFDWHREIPGYEGIRSGCKVANAGLVEVPVGISSAEVVYDIGGGCKDGKGKGSQSNRRTFGRLYSTV